MTPLAAYGERRKQASGAATKHGPGRRRAVNSVRTAGVAPASARFASGAAMTEDAVAAVSRALRASWEADEDGPWPDSEGLKDPDFDGLARIACHALWPSLDFAIASRLSTAVGDAERERMTGPHAAEAKPVTGGLWIASCTCGYRSGHCSWQTTAQSLANNHRLEHRAAAQEDARYAAERPLYYDDGPR